MMYKVVVCEITMGGIVQELPPVGSLRLAEKVEKGININLNHDKYFTEIMEVEA